MEVCLLTALLTAALPGQNAAFADVPTSPLAGELVRDPDRNVVVVFEAGTGRIWEWDGSTFRVRLGVSHSASSGCAWDPLRHRICAPQGGIWNGANWTSIAPSGAGSLAFDVARQRLVGVVAAGTPGVVEWDGMQWLHITPPASPGAGGVLVYDPGRAACVLAIGNPVSLWTWDGSQWNLLDGNGPNLGVNQGWTFAFAFDPVNNRLVVQGGSTVTASAGTWAFANGIWTVIPTPAAFSVSGTAMAHDGTGLLRLGASTMLPEGVWRLEGSLWRRLPVEYPALRVETGLTSTPALPGILVFGGRNSSTLYDDTWTYDGTWTRQQPAHVPPPRRNANLAWSPVNQAFLLYGGTGAQNAVLTDTWVWNGTDWLQQSPATSPGEALLVVTDPAGGALGLRRQWTGTGSTQWQWTGANWVNTPGHGASSSSPFLNAGYDPLRNVVTAAIGYQLWEWDGTNWTLRGALPSQNATAVVYRPDTRRMLFAFSPVMEWDGTAWITPNVSPPQPFTSGLGPILAADHARNRLFSFQHNWAGYGAWNGVSAVLTSTPASASRFGFGCAIGPSPGLLTDGRPVPGEASFGVACTTFAAGAPCILALGFQNQGVHLGGGCVSWIAQPPVLHFLVADAAGRTRSGLPIPNDTNLHGVTVLAQIAALDPLRSPLGSLTFSDGLRFTIGE